MDQIKAKITDQKIKDSIINKIENITYNGSDCSNASGSTVRGLLVENAFYNPNSQSFQFCNGFLLKNNSEFSMAMVIAHELSHSIDPCYIDQPTGASPITYQSTNTKLSEYEEQFPFKNVISCLRTKESVGARKLGNSDISANAGLNPFCSSDQIGESFSDWMGSGVLPEYISKYHSNLSTNQKVTGYSNVFRNLCKEESPYEVSTNEDVHPKITSRIDRIIMANHNSRKLLGCGEPKDDLHECKVGEDFKGTETKRVEDTRSPGGAK